MNRKIFITITAMLPWLASCAAKEGFARSHVHRIGMVVEEALAPGAAVKEGIQGISDAGQELFGSAELNSRNSSTSTYGGGVIPRWVRVTWREGADTARGLHWTTGKVVGDYTVPVLDRIPPEAFELARAGRKRFLVLRFRVRDDGVDFGWMVRLQDGVPFEVLMKGGDF